MPRDQVIIQACQWYDILEGANDLEHGSVSRTSA